MLINCVVYEDGKHLSDITVEEISEYVSRPGCFVWVALRDATDSELRQMQGEFNLHDLAIEDAKHGHQRPKVEEYGDVVFTVMHAVEIASADQFSVGEVCVFAGPSFVLSIRNQSQQHLLGVRERAEREPLLLRHGPGYVLYAVMDAVVDRYFPIIDLLEGELDSIECRIFDPNSTKANVRWLYELKQKLTVVRHAVTPLLDASKKLVRGRLPRICEGQREYYRDIYDHLERMQASLESLRETINTAIQVALSMATSEESETSKRTTFVERGFALCPPEGGTPSGPS